MAVRMPIVAGQFYPASADAADHQVQQCLDVVVNTSAVPRELVGGIVPHAGWTCSGKVAGHVFKAIQLRRSNVSTFVLFGAVHRYGVGGAAVYAEGAWRTPLGLVEIDEVLAGRIVDETKAATAEPGAHETEHSIEVQLPFIRHLFPKSKIVPIMVPPGSDAVSAGSSVGQIIRDSGADAVCIGSTDLTHYGPGYGFTPKGSGAAGIRWAKEVNDRELLDLICKLDPQGVLEYAERWHAACGSGAIAATIAAAKVLGGESLKATVLEHTTSAEVLSERYGAMIDSVGYAALVFGTD